MQEWVGFFYLKPKEFVLENSKTYYLLGLPYWSQIDFIIYWTWTNLKKLGLPYWTGTDFVINWTWIEEMN